MNGFVGPKWSRETAACAGGATSPFGDDRDRTKGRRFRIQCCEEFRICFAMLIKVLRAECVLPNGGFSGTPFAIVERVLRGVPV